MRRGDVQGRRARRPVDVNFHQLGGTKPIPRTSIIPYITHAGFGP